MARILLCAGVVCGVLALQPVHISAAQAENPEMAQKLAAAQVPVDKLPEAFRGKAADLLRRASVYTRGPVQAFPCRAEVFDWLLDHPQCASRAWRALGAPCTMIQRKEDGSFTAAHEHSGEVHWTSILSEPGRRIWFAEASGRAAPLMPTVSMRAVFILHYEQVKGRDGRPGIRQQAEVFAHFEDRTALWLTRLCGASMDANARKTLEQIGFFFLAMSWYVCDKPDGTAKVLEALPAEEARQLEALLQRE